MYKLLVCIDTFQKMSPVPESEEMISLLSEIVEEYDALVNNNHPLFEKIKWIKYGYLDKDWKFLSHNSLLYPKG